MGEQSQVPGIGPKPTFKDRFKNLFIKKPSVTNYQAPVKSLSQELQSAPDTLETRDELEKIEGSNEKPITFEEQEEQRKLQDVNNVFGEIRQAMQGEDPEKQHGEDLQKAQKALEPSLSLQDDIDFFNQPIEEVLKMDPDLSKGGYLIPVREPKLQIRILLDERAKLKKQIETGFSNKTEEIKKEEIDKDIVLEVKDEEVINTPEKAQQRITEIEDEIKGIAEFQKENLVIQAKGKDIVQKEGGADVVAISYQVGRLVKSLQNLRFADHPWIDVYSKSESGNFIANGSFREINNYLGFLSDALGRDVVNLNSDDFRSPHLLKKLEQEHKRVVNEIQQTRIDKISLNDRTQKPTKVFYEGLVTIIDDLYTGAKPKMEALEQTLLKNFSGDVAQENKPE